MRKLTSMPSELINHIVLHYAGYELGSRGSDAVIVNNNLVSFKLRDLESINLGPKDNVMLLRVLAEIIKVISKNNYDWFVADCCITTAERIYNDYSWFFRPHFLYMRGDTSKRNYAEFFYEDERKTADYDIDLIYDPGKKKEIIEFHDRSTNDPVFTFELPRSAAVISKVAFNLCQSFAQLYGFELALKGYLLNPLDDISKIPDRECFDTIYLFTEDPVKWIFDRRFRKYVTAEYDGLTVTLKLRSDLQNVPSRYSDLEQFKAAEALVLMHLINNKSAKFEIRPLVMDDTLFFEDYVLLEYADYGSSLNYDLFD